MKSKGKRLLITLALALGLTLTLLWLLDGGLSARAAPAAELRVCPSGCTYSSIQAAVDAANAGDVIKVAQGTYTDIHQRAGITQVVYISKTVTVRGGYTTTNDFADPPDPVANPTTLNARGLGRVLVISGTFTPTVEGLRITGGDAAGLGGGLAGRDAGGGVYVYEATATVSNCVVFSNTASTASSGSGGGVGLNKSDATLSSNTVVSNTASTADQGWGGGLYLLASDATLSGNTVQGNTASTASTGYGGGVGLRWSDATLSGNTVRGNTASTVGNGYGGGLYIRLFSDATLSGNTVQGNTASTASTGRGGGLYLQWSAATLSGNTIVSNTATLHPTDTGQGGGLLVRQSSPFILTNNLVADNHANTEGSGLWFDGSDIDPTSGRLLHTTIADNRSSGQGVFVDDYTTLAFTNTIIAGHHSVGITVTTGSTVTLQATLWHNNGAHTGGGGTIVTGTVNVHEDAAFANPSAWDYHLTAGSAAIDAGAEAGVTTDIDGDPRPVDGDLDGTATVDIGADEFTLRHIYLPVVLRNYIP